VELLGAECAVMMMVSISISISADQQPRVRDERDALPEKIPERRTRAHEPRMLGLRGSPATPS
jgi:hypothetical protein